jgi:hypothetical protein
MVGRWKGGGKEDCKLLNQQRTDTAKLKTQRPGEAIRLRQSSQGENKADDDSMPLQNSLFRQSQPPRCTASPPACGLE